MNAAYQRGKELMESGKNAAALVALEEAMRQDPNHFKAAFSAGLVLQRLEKYEEAIAAFSKVMEIQPRIPQAHYSRALCLHKLRRYEEALTDLDIALDLDPGYIDALYARGMNLKGLERYDEALEAYEIVLGKSGGKYPPASHGRATLRHMTGDYEGAISDFTVCIANGLDRDDVRFLRGLAYYRTGRFAEARDDLAAAIALNPRHGSAYAHRGLLLCKLGEQELGKQDLERSKELLGSVPRIKNEE